MAQRISAILALVVLVSASAARAEDGAVEKLYGEGVHAFFAGNLAAAQKHLDASVAAGNRDPRCYYYRGLTLARLGMADAAKADLQQGATLEAQSPESTSLINRSIQRIQGSTRLALEKYRSDAQVAALAARKAREAQRYGAARASAIQELEKQAAPATNTDLLPDATTQPDAAEATDPAATDAAADNPFGDDPATTDPAAADPADAAPSDEMPADEPPAAEAPETEEAPAVDDPPAIEETPEVEPPATEEDPDGLFGEEPATP